MCGIYGFNFKNDGLADAMSRALAHRGPDDTGVFSDNIVTFGHRRLSIIDLSSLGHQPMHDRENKICITYNGEIYNFNELKEDLAGKGYQFKSKTDTEVILNGYKEYGNAFFGKLRGMWALAIYDPIKKIIILSRDPLGIKPLYYSVRGNKFAFASEINPLKKFFENEGLKMTLSKTAAGLYFVLGYVPHPETVFEKVKKVDPGEILSFDTVVASASSEHVDFNGRERTVSSPSDFESVMLESVEKHLIADVPVGIFLSGGADSALLAVLLKKLGRNPAAFTARIAGKKDADFAKKIADFSGLDRQEIVLDGNVFEDAYERTFEFLDEPVADTAIISSMAVSREAAKHVKVVMTGEGADELFWGYERYASFNTFSSVGKKFLGFSDKLENLFYLKYLKPIFRRARLAYFNGKKDLLGGYLEHAAIDSDFACKSSAYKYLSKKFAGAVDPEVSFFDEKIYLPDDLLKKTDLATMSYSIEGRVPFLDKEVYRFAKNLPGNEKMSSGIGKKVIKDYLAKNLPVELIFRGKEGFSVSPAKYILPSRSGEIKEAMRYILDVCPGLVSAPALSRALSDGKYFDFINSKFPQTVFSWLAFYKVCKK